jgi:protease-4
MGLLTSLLRPLRNLGRRLLASPPDYVVLEAWGELPEFDRCSGLLRRWMQGMGASPVSLQTLRQRLERILADGRPDGVILKVGRLQSGWASLEELRAELSRFREHGKRVVAHLTECGTAGYYLATAADEILITPSTTVNTTGLRTRIDFLADGLRRVGISAEVFAVSPYKSAGDRFVRDDLSPQAREQAERLLDARFSRLLEAIAEGRNISQKEAARRIDDAPYAPEVAVQEGLVDGLCYEDELEGRVGERITEWGRARRSLLLARSERRRIGVVGVEGTIVQGTSRNLPLPLPLIGGKQAGSDSVVAALRTAEKSRAVRAILLYVNSPGGDALASDLIRREVERIGGKKPVVALMGESAASGGYEVCAPASHVTARRNTLTGSIGVLIIRPVLTGAYRKAGITPVTLQRGARSGLFDESRPLSEGEKEALGQQLQHSYAQFKQSVAKGRDIPEEDLEGVSGGRVWSGDEAAERRLVDGTGGFREAYSKACELAGIDPRHGLRWVSPPSGRRSTPELPPRSSHVWAIAPCELSEV